VALITLLSLTRPVLTLGIWPSGICPALHISMKPCHTVQYYTVWFTQVSSNVAVEHPDSHRYQLRKEETKEKYLSKNMNEAMYFIRSTNYTGAGRQEYSTVLCSTAIWLAALCQHPHETCAVGSHQVSVIQS